MTVIVSVTDSTVVPTPDVAAIAGWLATWFGTCTTGNIEIAWTDPGDGKLRYARNFPLGQWAEAATFAAGVNATPGQSCYFCAATVSRGDHRRSSDADFIQSPGVWLDQDKPEHTAVEPWLRPTLTIVTGRIPHLRRQMFFQCDAPLADPQTVTDFNRRLFGVMGGDSMVQNPTSLMRLPGTIAWPRKAGRVPERTEWSFDEGGRRYAPVQLSAYLPARREDQDTAPAPANPGNRLNVQEAIDGLAPGSWHDSMIRLVGRYVSKGLTDEEILAFAPAWTLPGYAVDQTLSEIQVAIDGFRSKHGIPDNPGALVTNDRELALEALATAPAITPELGPTQLPILNLSEFVSRYGHKPEFLVEDWVVEGVPTMMVGLPGAGKSPIAQKLAAHVCLGLPYFGLQVKQQRVVLLAGESANQAAINIRRFAAMALAEHTGEPLTEDVFRRAAEYMDEWFAVIPARFAVETDADAVVQTIKNYADVRWGGEGPGLVIWDTLRAVTVGSIIKDEDVALMHAGINKVQIAWPKVTNLVLHHSPKADPEASSGSNRLDGWADVHLVVTMHKQTGGEAQKAPEIWGPDDEGRTYSRIRLMARRNKVWAVPQPLWMNMVFHEDTLGLEKTDAPGQAIPSATPPITDAPGFAAIPGAIAQALPAAQQTENVLVGMLAQHGELSPANIMERVNAMQVAGAPLPKQVWDKLGVGAASKTQRDNIRKKLDAMVAAGIVAKRREPGSRETFYRLV